MNRLARLIGSFSTSRKSSWEHIWLKNREREALSEDILGSVYKRSELAYICISTTARAISQVPLLVMEPSSNHSDRYQPVVPDHPAQRLLNKPNFRTNRYNFLTQIVSFWLADGEAFVIPYPPDTSSLPASLWTVRGKFMQERVDNNGVLLGWLYKPKENLEIPLSAAEVIQVWFLNPDDANRGMAPHIAGSVSIVSDYQAARYNQAFFKNGAVPDGILSTEQILPNTAFERLKEQFEARHGGYERAHRFAILEGGLKYTATALNQRDMEFMDSRKFDSSRVMQIYGMKGAVIGERTDLNNATSQEEKAEWWETTNLPLMSWIEDSLTSGLFPTSSPLKVKFDTSSITALHSAFQARVNTGVKLFQMGFTPNEVNDKLELGFDDKPWRDSAYFPVNLLAVGGGDANSNDPQPTEPPVTNPKPVDEGDGKGKSLIDIPDTTVSISQDALWRSLVTGSEPIERKFESKVSRLFMDMRKRTLQRLFTESKSIEDVQSDEYKDEQDKIAEWVAAYFLAALTLGMDSITTISGEPIEIPVDDPVILQFLANKDLQIRGVVDTVKRQIRNEISLGMANGETVEQIAERIKTKFNFASKRALTIARTEVFGAINYGRSITLKRSGYARKRWITAMDERVRPQHMVMHGRTVGVDENWIVDGKELRFPGDPKGPAYLVINCRCIEQGASEGTSEGVSEE
jgi:HK97 family phage portal protein